MKLYYLKYAKLIILNTLIIVFLLSLTILLNSSGDFAPAPVITYSTQNPEEKHPSEAGYKWSGQKDDPKYIVIPKIKVDTFVQNVGIDQNQQIAVPNNINIAGWFVDSVRPGEAGLSIIDGHVNGVSGNDGLFKRLNELVPGDTAQVITGEGAVVSFIVRSNQEIKTEDSATVLYSQDPNIKSQLNLITCTGNFNSSIRQYDKRQITVLEQQ